VKVASASVALIVVGSPCEASYFTRQAASGKPTTAYVYRNWDKDCRERGGVVKVVTKPQAWAPNKGADSGSNGSPGA